MQHLTLGPLTVVHDAGIPIAIDGSDEVDGLPPDVAEELLECPSLVARCELDALDNLAELDFD